MLSLGWAVIWALLTGPRGEYLRTMGRGESEREKREKQEEGKKEHGGSWRRRRKKGLKERVRKFASLSSEDVVGTAVKSVVFLHCPPVIRRGGQSCYSLAKASVSVL